MAIIRTWSHFRAFSTDTMRVGFKNITSYSLKRFKVFDRTTFSMLGISRRVRLLVELFAMWSAYHTNIHGRRSMYQSLTNTSVIHGYFIKVSATSRYSL